MKRRGQFKTFAQRSLLRISMAVTLCFLPLWSGMSAARETLQPGLSHGVTPSGSLSETIVKGQPELGIPEQDLTYAGALWWFSNIGTKAAFLDAPEIYMPQFVGYGVVTIALGVPGNRAPADLVAAGGNCFCFTAMQPELRGSKILVS